MVSLFCGIGGFELAAAPWGPEVVFANDKDDEALRTYRRNFASARVVPGPVEEIDWAAAVPAGGVDLLTAGFPCQSFSILGKRLGLGAPSGAALSPLLEAIERLRPRALLLENVKGFVSHDGGSVLALVVQKLRALGYDVDWKVLNARTHGGVPQNRERLFIVGLRVVDDGRAEGDPPREGLFPWPGPIPLASSLDQLLSERPAAKYDIRRTTSRLNADIWATVTEAGKIWTRARCLYRQRRGGTAGDGGGEGSGSEDVCCGGDDDGGGGVDGGGVDGGEGSVLKPFTLPGIAPTLTASMGVARANMSMLLGPRGPRVMSPRECARLQGLPDEFVIHETDRHAYSQIGNTVCVPLVRRILEALFLPNP